MASEERVVDHLRVVITEDGLSKAPFSGSTVLRFLPVPDSKDEIGGLLHNQRLNSVHPHEHFAMSDENIVYIGSKPVMNYCLAVLSSLQGDGSTVALKARGRAISTAVDVAEVTKNRFMQDLSVESIEIGTEELESMEGQMRNVSTISIVLKKG